MKKGLSLFQNNGKDDDDDDDDDDDYEDEDDDDDDDSEEEMQESDKKEVSGSSSQIILFVFDFQMCSFKEVWKYMTIKRDIKTPLAYYPSFCSGNY